MPNSIAPVSVGTEKIDVFLASGFTVGESLWVQNIGSKNINFAILATEPTTQIGGYLPPYHVMLLDPGEPGLWMWTDVGNSVVAVQKA